MLRPFALMLDILSAMLGLIVPVCVIHWLLGIFEIPTIEPVMGFLDACFSPFNGLITSILPFELPVIDWQGKSVPITQGILAFLLTVSFITIALAANILRETNRKMDITSNTIKMQHKMRQKKAANEKAKKKAYAANRILIHLVFKDDTQKVAQKHFSKFRNFSGQQHKGTTVNGFVLEFNDFMLATKYVLQSAERLSAHYATLRPMDVKPPFQMVLHAVEPSPIASEEGIKKTDWMTRYAGENKIVFSQEFHELMNANKAASDFQFQTLGYYEIAGDPAQEVFQLTYKSHDTNVYY